MFTTGLEGLLAKVAATGSVTAAGRVARPRHAARTIQPGPATPTLQDPRPLVATVPGASGPSAQTAMPVSRDRAQTIQRGPGSTTQRVNLEGAPAVPAGRTATPQIADDGGPSPWGGKLLPPGQIPKTKEEQIAALRRAGIKTERIRAMEGLDEPAQVAAPSASASRSARAESGTVGVRAKGTPANGMRAEGAPAQTMQGGSATIVSGRPFVVNKNVAPMTPQARQQAAARVPSGVGQQAAAQVPTGVGQRAARTLLGGEAPAPIIPRKAVQMDVPQQAAAAAGGLPEPNKMRVKKLLEQDQADAAAGIGQQAAQAATGGAAQAAGGGGSAAGTGQQAATGGAAQAASGGGGDGAAGTGQQAAQAATGGAAQAAGNRPGWWDNLGWKTKALGALGGGYLLSRALREPIHTYEDDQYQAQRGANVNLPIY